MLGLLTLLVMHALSVAPQPTMDMTFVGDMIYGRYRSGGYDPIPEHDADVLAQVRPLLRADLTVGNLETPLVRTLPTRAPIGSRFAFGAPPDMAQLLSAAGFHAVSVANNHWFDQRERGLAQTPEILAEHNVLAVGALPDAHAPVVFTHAGVRVALLAATARTNAPLREHGIAYVGTHALAQTLAPMVEAASASSDVQVVLIHWGDEYVDRPSVAQRRAAHALVDAGAELVIGHHPHVLQGIERYGNGLIAYSLGNFLFENLNTKPRQTGVLRVSLRPDGCLARVRFHPVVLMRHPDPHPEPASGVWRTRIHKRMQSLSARLDTDWHVDGNDLTLVPEGGCERER